MRKLLLTQGSELVQRDCPDEMAQFLAADDPVTESVEALDHANKLITQIMDYIRKAKSNLSMIGHC